MPLKLLTAAAALAFAAAPALSANEHADHARADACCDDADCCRDGECDNCPGDN